MEQYAYEYAVDKLCYAPTKIKKISMSTLFDMVAGTSTGALLATTLVLPSNKTDKDTVKNMYWA